MNYQIKNSYNYNIAAMFSMIQVLRSLGKLGDSRSDMSYVKEWYAHNILYKLGLFRSHTRDVDLNDNETLTRRFAYNVIYYTTFGWLQTRKYKKKSGK